MKKNSALILAVSVVLLAVALIMMGTGFVSGKLANGGCSVRIEVGESYDAEVAKGYVEAAGFANPVIMESNRTAIEVETSAMSAEKLTAAADKLLASVQADHASAELSYAEAFEAPTGAHFFKNLMKAMAAFVVLAYVYAAMRFGWCKGAAAVLTALVAAVVTGSVCVILSAVFTLGSALTAVVAGVACLTYVYTVDSYAKRKAGVECKKCELAVPVLVAVGAVLVCVSCGSIGLSLAAVVGSVVALAGVYCVAPIFWGACAK